MPQLTIGNQTVTVDDSFLKLSPDQQNATVEEIHRSLGGKNQADNEPSFASGMVRSAARGVPIIGGLLNKADAATDAALAPVMNPLFPEKEQLKGDFGQRYRQALGVQEGEDTAFSKAHPYASTGAEIAGGIAGLGGAAMTNLGAKALGLTAKTLPGMMAQGAASGAAIGGLDTGVRGGDVTEGALYGGAAGAAGPIIGKAVGEVVAPVARVVRGLRDPLAEAGRRVVGGIERDVSAGNAGLTEPEFRAAKAAGQPVAIMDLGGETTRALQRSAANTSPEARGVLDRFTSDRFGGQGGRLQNWFNSKFNYPDAEATQEAIDQTARTVNRPAYARAYAKGAGGIWNADLEQMAQAPVVQDAIRKTMVSAKNDAARLGFTPPKNPFVTDTSGRLTLGTGPNGTTLTPGLQFWDYVKRNLDKVGTREAKDWARVLRQHLDGLIPEYGAARAGAAKLFGAEDALEAGKNAVTSKMQNPQILAGLAKMSPVEKKLFQDGFVSEYIKMIRESGDRRSILNTVAKSDAARERIMMAIGPQRARELESFLHVERIMDGARTALGNSTTARQLAELGLAGGYNLYEGGGKPSQDPEVLMKTLAIYGVLRGSRSLGQHIDERVVKHVADLLTSDNLADLEKGMKLIARNKTLFKAVSAADAGIGSVVTRGAVSGARDSAQEGRDIYVHPRSGSQ